MSSMPVSSMSEQRTTVHIEHNFSTMGVDVWIVERGRLGRGVLQRGDGTGFERWVPLSEGSYDRPPPTYSFPEGIFEQLMMAGQKVVQATDATLDALADTRTVRDRLLTIVETEIAARPRRR